MLVDLIFPKLHMIHEQQRGVPQYQSWRLCTTKAISSQQQYHITHNHWTACSFTWWNSWNSNRTSSACLTLEHWSAKVRWNRTSARDEKQGPASEIASPSDEVSFLQPKNWTRNVKGNEVAKKRKITLYLWAYVFFHIFSPIKSKMQAIW